MRNGKDAKFIEVDGVVVGVSLGADFVSEHEWGIKGIKADFGIDSAKLGIDGRAISKSAVHWYEDKDIAGFTTVGPAGWDDKPRSMDDVLTCCHIHKPETYGKKEHRRSFFQALQTAWDERSFAAFSADASERTSLRSIYDALIRNDAAIMLSGGGVFQNSGLTIFIRTLIPAEKCEQMYSADAEAARMESLVKTSGIRERLKAAGRGYFALSRAHVKDGTLVFWLNPMEQDKNNFGWFTIADLDAWTEGKGPIPKHAA